MIFKMNQTMKRFLVITVVTLSLLVEMSFNSFAMNTGYSIEEYPSESSTSFIDALKIEILKDEPTHHLIRYFDVNENGDVAICFDDVDSKECICVYNKYGAYKYSYRFSCSGDYYVEWDNDNLNIHFVRSSAIAAVNTFGDVEEIFTVSNTYENNAYSRELRAKTRIKGDITYTLKNNKEFADFLYSSYAKIIVIDETKETVIYEAEQSVQNERTAKVLGIFAFAVVCLFCITVIVLLWVRKSFIAKLRKRCYK